MKVCERLCVKDYEIHAKNGDYWKAERGRSYTTSRTLEDGTVNVFSNYWVNVPAGCFAGPVELVSGNPLPENW